MLEEAPGRAHGVGSTGPAGWVPDVPWDTHPALYPPTPALAGLPGPASLVQDLLARQLGSTRYSPPATHPVPIPHPGTTHPAPLYPHTAMVHHTLTACTYGRFDTDVGEPRGVEYSAVSGSRTGLWTLD